MTILNLQEISSKPRPGASSSSLTTEYLTLAHKTYLDVVLVDDLVELSLVGTQLGHLEGHAGMGGGAQVGRAERQEAKAVVVAGPNLVDTGYHAMVDLRTKKKSVRNHLVL